MASKGRHRRTSPLPQMHLPTHHLIGRFKPHPASRLDAPICSSSRFEVAELARAISSRALATPHLPAPSGRLSCLSDLVSAAKAQGFEGLVAKRGDSRYRPGARSGAWQKMRINQGQEFVIGGYTVGGALFDALVFGYYKEGKLLYASRTRNGFTPRLRAELMKRFQALETNVCPFVNLPEKRTGRWGAGLTAAKMAVCRWLKPVLVGQFEFTEWTEDAHLRHSRFVGLREDKAPNEVGRER